MEDKDDIGSILKNLKEDNRNALKNIFSVPNGYFDLFPEKLMDKIRQGNEMMEEHAMFPGLTGISREMPFEVPPYYFEATRNYRPGPSALIPFRKGISIAASFIIIATASMLLTTRGPKEGTYQPSVVSINELTNDQLERFVGSTVTLENTYTDLTGRPAISTATLLKDVPSEDLSDFLDETAETTVEQTQPN